VLGFASSTATYSTRGSDYEIRCVGQPGEMGFPLSVGAWSERLATDTALSPDQQMQMSPVEVSRYYADQLIWYDALSILGDALM